MINITKENEHLIESFEENKLKFDTLKFGAMDFPALISELDNILTMIIDDDWHTQVRKKAEYEFLKNKPDLKDNIDSYILTEAEIFRFNLGLLWSTYRRISCLDELDQEMLNRCYELTNVVFINERDIEQLLFGNMYKNIKIRDEINSLILKVLSRTYIDEENGAFRFTFDSLEDINAKINGDLMFLSTILYKVLLINFKEPHAQLQQELAKVAHLTETPEKKT